jgi:hypothetical protein
MTELQELLDSKYFSGNTKKSYNQAYNKLINSGLFTFGIHQTNNFKIIDFIKAISTNPNTIFSLLNICIQLKLYFDKDITQLEKFRQKVKADILIHKQISNKNLIVPKYQDMKLHMENLYDTDDFVGYIVNFLLINYSVRNLDLSLKIIDSKSDVVDGDNYLLIRSKDIVYVRTNYKTFKTYGVKKNIIANKKFIKAVKNIGVSPLLVGVDNTRIPDTSLGYFIPKKLFNNSTESLYFKAILEKNKGNNAFLMKASHNRGTSLTTILGSYDVSNVSPVDINSEEE